MICDSTSRETHDMRVGMFPFTNLVLRLRFQDEVPADLAVVSSPEGGPHSPAGEPKERAVGKAVSHTLA